MLATRERTRIESDSIQAPSPSRRRAWLFLGAVAALALGAGFITENHSRAKQKKDIVETLERHPGEWIPVPGNRKD
jgi:hypothetical protein